MSSSFSNQIYLYTDGACSRNPGPGGWGCILIAKTRERRLSGYESETTNNRMELMAVIKGLECLKRPSQVHVVTDSKYIHHAFSKQWIDNWQRRNWVTSTKEPVKNKDLWLILIELNKKHVLSWEWVKGHSGHKYNDMCDELARKAIKNKAGSDETHEN